MTAQNKIIILSVIVLLFISNIFLMLVSIDGWQKKGVNTSVGINSQNSTLPRSNIEWLENIISLPSGHVDGMTMTTTVKGFVERATRGSGKFGGLEHYYIKEPGYYYFEGKIELVDSDNQKSTYFFSPRRMQIIKVYRVSNGKQTEIGFDDIKPGDEIEIEEAADLIHSNINDENVKYLKITVLNTLST